MGFLLNAGRVGTYDDTAATEHAYYRWCEQRGVDEDDARAVLDAATKDVQYRRHEVGENPYTLARSRVEERSPR